MSSKPPGRPPRRVGRARNGQDEHRASLGSPPRGVGQAAPATPVGKSAGLTLPRRFFSWATAWWRATLFTKHKFRPKESQEGKDPKLGSFVAGCYRMLIL